MSMSLLWIWVATIVTAVCLIGVAGSHALRARAESVEHRSELRTVAAHASELVQLRSLCTDFPARPDGGLASKVASALSRAALVNSVLQGLSPEAQTILNGDNGIRLNRQRATLTLANLSLPQVGKFLDAWRTAEPDWIISGIDLSPVNAQGGSSVGTDLPLRAVITIEGLFKEPARDPFIGVSR